MSHKSHCFIHYIWKECMRDFEKIESEDTGNEQTIIMGKIKYNTVLKPDGILCGMYLEFSSHIMDQLFVASMK